MRIGTRDISNASPVLVIAEIGVNHDGSVDRALQLVQMARECGADAVKLQIFQAERLMHRCSAFARYQQQEIQNDSPEAMLRRYELSPESQRIIVNAIRSAGLIPLATPFSVEDVASIELLDLPAVKIASPDLVNLPLLRRCAKLNRPLILSTGAATMEEVATTVGWMKDWNLPFALLHCVSSYPTETAQANLGWIAEIATRFNATVGYSDHTTEVHAGAFATLVGACIIEKHLTYDRAAKGPDHSASADAGQFAEYVRLIRLAETMRGSTGKQVLPIEIDVRNVSRQSLVLARAVPAGEMIGAEDIIVQRPGTGIPAAQIDQVIGRQVLETLSAGNILQWSHLGDAD